MSFAAWTFLFGIIAVAGPVLAHFLARPRYRRVPFTMLQFLKSSQIESHSRRHLRDLLILLLRCMIILLIAFLFAQPIIFTKAKQKGMHNIYYLGLDDSVSMAYADSGDTYFKQMRDLAIDYIVSSESDSVFNVCSLVSGNWNYGLNKQQALAQVQALDIKPKKADIGAFISGLSDSSKNTKEGDNICAYLISDFTGNNLQQFLNVQEPAVVDNIEYKLISSSKPITNASIVSASATDYKNNKLSIDATVNNNGQTRQNRKLYAIIGNEKAASIDVELNPGQSKVCPLVINADSINKLHSYVPIELILTPNDNLNEDDKFYLAVRIPKQTSKNVLLVETKEDEMFLLDTAIRTISEKSTNSKYNVRRIPIAKMNTSDLKWANIFMCAIIPGIPNSMIKIFSDFIETGGKAVFFLNDEPLADTAEKLWQQKALAALPIKCIKEQTNLNIDPGAENLPGIDNDAVKALTNYQINRISLSGYWDCRPLPESTCLGTYKNGGGFIYYKIQGNGTSILVNTSIDESLGSLFKSSASVALCQCLLGEKKEILNSSFTCDDRIILTLDNDGTSEKMQRQIWILNCNGQKQLVSVINSYVTVPESEGKGWVKTVSEPIIYAGVNLPAGETNMAKPDTREIENAVSRVFITGDSSLMARGSTVDSRRMNSKSLVPILIWVLIALLLIESAAANRMKR
jgi:hypothetical protein